LAFSLHFLEPHLLSGDGRPDRVCEGGLRIASLENKRWLLRPGREDSSKCLSEQAPKLAMAGMQSCLLQPDFRLECAQWWCEGEEQQRTGGRRRGLCSTRPLRNATLTFAPRLMRRRWRAKDTVLCTPSPCPALFGSSCDSGIAWKNGLLFGANHYSGAERRITPLQVRHGQGLRQSARWVCTRIAINPEPSVHQANVCNGSDPQGKRSDRFWPLP
jgi:hypothetical protein